MNEVRSFNSRLDPLQAAVLRVKLAHLDDWNARRKAIAAQYRVGLADCGLGLPQVPAFADPVWHLFVVRHPRRDELQKRLAERGVGSLIHYPIPPHRQAAYADAGFAPGDFPLANMQAEQVLSLPMGPHLSRADADEVVQRVREAVAE